jgi:hypothetical protein
LIAKAKLLPTTVRSLTHSITSAGRSAPLATSRTRTAQSRGGGGGAGAGAAVRNRSRGATFGAGSGADACGVTGGARGTAPAHSAAEHAADPRLSRVCARASHRLKAGTFDVGGQKTPFPASNPMTTLLLEAFDARRCRARRRVTLLSPAARAVRGSS